MLIFNELRITPDQKYLIIDVSVDNQKYYENIQIDSIIIDTQDTYIDSGPSNNPIFTYNLTEENSNITQVYTDNYTPVLDEDTSYCYVESEEKQNKSIRLILNYQDLNVSLQDNMFFVYAIATGTPSADTPCGMDNSIVKGTIINLYPIYCKTIQYLKELDDSCVVPKNFIDMIIKLKALELSIKTGNSFQAIEYWNKYFKTLINNNSIFKSKYCGCNN